MSLPPTERPPYVPAPDRYDAMTYRRGRAERARTAGDLARPVAELRGGPAARDGSGRSCAAPSIAGSPTSISRTTTARRTGPPRRTFGRDPRQGLPALPRRAGHLARRPATTCGRARTATTGRASTCSPASTRACSAWASTTSTSSTRTGSTRTRRSRRRIGALDTAVRPGKALYVGHLVVLGRADDEGRRHPARPRDAAADPPAVVLDAQPLDRGRAARRRSRPRASGCIAFSPLAQGMLTDKYLDGVPAGLARRRQGHVLSRLAHRGEAGQGPRAERDRPAARPDPRPDGARLDRCATRA